MKPGQSYERIDDQISTGQAFDSYYEANDSNTL